MGSSGSRYPDAHQGLVNGMEPLSYVYRDLWPNKQRFGPLSPGGPLKSCPSEFLRSSPLLGVENASLSPFCIQFTLYEAGSDGMLMLYMRCLLMRHTAGAYMKVVDRMQNGFFFSCVTGFPPLRC